MFVGSCFMFSTVIEKQTFDGQAVLLLHSTIELNDLRSNMSLLANRDSPHVACIVVEDDGRNRLLR